ncbi:MAG: hypothetical protein CMK70_13435 [Pseudohongiella sp.]|nr:hypothetical protein [Pseudohongiella sp.]|tara:strand:+ start:32093 stop:32392 length:300 start_codon:yes stop_codon:yes gene_type:complete
MSDTTVTTVPFPDEFTEKVGAWWDSLTTHQRGMLVYAHHLELIGVHQSIRWSQIPLFYQARLALKLSITMGITRCAAFPELTEEAYLAINNLQPSTKLH